MKNWSKLFADNFVLENARVKISPLSWKHFDELATFALEPKIWEKNPGH